MQLHHKVVITQWACKKSRLKGSKRHFNPANNHGQRQEVSFSMATGVVEVEQKNTGKNKLPPVTTVTTRYHHSVLSALFGYLSLPHSFAGTLNSQELLLEAASRCGTWKVQEG